jgi:hypothetical protein
MIALHLIFSSQNMITKKGKFILYEFYIIIFNEATKQMKTLEKR